MSRARFLYGVAAGFGGGWLLLTLLEQDSAPWLIVATAASLALALLLHRHSARASLGRRWRSTLK